MPSKLMDIEGIGQTYATTLADAGLNTTDDLLEAAGSASGRDKLAEKTGLTTRQILEWVNRADLMRIKGVGSEFSDLLEASGVDTVKELATRVPANLQAKMAKVNAARRLVRRSPNLSEVESWVAEAKTLKVMVTDAEAGSRHRQEEPNQFQHNEASIWETLIAIADSIPEQDCLRLPRDGAANHDRYLYNEQITNE